MNRRLSSYAALVGVALLGAGCGKLDRALTARSRPAAEVAGIQLKSDVLGRILAESSIPDSALSPLWAEQFATLWADFVRLAVLYRSPDTTTALDYEPLLRGQHYFDAIAVDRYRDSMVLAGIEPTDEELRDYFDKRQPFTRLDVRRIRLSLPTDASRAVRDSMFKRAREIRRRLTGGADFLTVAREESDEPPGARGQLLSFQGHDDFEAAADSIVFRLRPGEISPVVPGTEAMLLYRIEKRIQPEFERAKDRVRLRMVTERTKRVSLQVADTLVHNARRAVMKGAEQLALRLAGDSLRSSTRVAPGTKLVTYRDGAVTAGELRNLFHLREDMRRRFAGAPEDSVHEFLLALARDEILSRAARINGYGPTESEKATLNLAFAAQLSALARQLKLSHNLVISPRYQLEREGIGFLKHVLQVGESLPWLGVFRMVLDPVVPARVDPRGAEAAARLALKLRESGEVVAATASESDGASGAAGTVGTDTAGEGQPELTPPRSFLR